MESGPSLAARNPCLLASPRMKVGPGAGRFPGLRRRTRGARLVATGAPGRRSCVSVERKLSSELVDGGVGATSYGDRRRKNTALAFIEKEFSGIEGFVGRDHEDGDDEEEEGRHGRGKGKRSEDTTDDEEDTTTTDEEDTTDDEEDTTDDEDTTDEEDTTDDEDEGECDD